ncbi:MAG: hypothetical protein COT31_03715, partial [Candidatus Moranbacteria bacterium CG08_land_8_20_14_0_20_34_16]
SDWLWKIYFCLWKKLLIKIFFLKMRKKQSRVIKTKKNSHSEYHRKGSSLFYKVMFYLLFFPFLFYLFYAIFFSEFLTINTIKINGNSTIAEEIIKEKTQKEISGEYFFGNRKNNLFLVSGKKIEGNISSAIRKIKTVHITKKFPHSLIVEIEERGIFLAVCVLNKENCYLLDGTGEAFDVFSPNSQTSFPILYSNFEEKIGLGESVLDRKYMEKIIILQKKLKENSAFESEYLLETPSFISQDVRVKTKEGWRIFFNFDTDLEKQFQKLKLILEKEIPLDKRKNLEYIDLRIENKVFYKFF